jgi:FAD/FMN-containing dehydrogenase
MSVLDALRSAFGADQVLSGPDALPFERDWRGQFPSKALAVLRPRGVDEVQAMLRHTHALGLNVVPQGGNTGLVGGSTPDNSGDELVLSLRRLNQVRSIDVINRTVSAEAGCVLANLQSACRDEGLLLPLSMASEGSCTLGGNLATNAGGTQVLRWGNARDLCLGLEVVTVDGQLWRDMDGLRKDHRGLNLRDLFIGSEGTLGVVTAAVMKVDLLPRSRLAAWVTLPSLNQVYALLDLARHQLGPELSGFELMGETVQSLLSPLPLPAAPWAVLLELSSTDPDAAARPRMELLLADILRLGALDAVLSQSEAQFRSLWALREAIPEAQTRAGGNLKHDISLRIDKVGHFIEETDAWLRRHHPGVQAMVFGHLGDGNLHYNIAPPSGTLLAEFRLNPGPAISRYVFDTVRACGGSFSAEHGIGRLRADELAAFGDPLGLELMRRVKQAFDPANRLNPGRMLQAQR